MSVAAERVVVRAHDDERCARERYFENRGGAPAPAAGHPSNPATACTASARPADSASLAEPPSLHSRLRRALSILHRIIGAPDYDGYVAHARQAHPDRPILTRDEFVRQRLEDKYSRPGSRCC